MESLAWFPVGSFTHFLPKFNTYFESTALIRTAFIPSLHRKNVLRPQRKYQKYHPKALFYKESIKNITQRLSSKKLDYLLLLRVVLSS